MKNKNLIISLDLYQKIFKPIPLKVKIKEGLTVVCTAAPKIPKGKVISSYYLCEFKELAAPKFGNVFGINIDGLVTYYTNLDNIKPDKNNNKIFDPKGSQQIKPSKLIKYILDFTDIEITETSVNLENIDTTKIKNRLLELISAKVGTTLKKSIKVSKDPRSIYLIETSPKKTGTLGSSCMNAEATNLCTLFSEVYNTVGAKIAYILDDNGKLFARALLWDKLHINNGKDVIKFMDRIYGNEEAMEALKSWAHENDYAYKAVQDYTTPSFVLPNNKTVRSSAYFECDSKIYVPSGVPYFDSLGRTNDGTKLFTPVGSTEYTYSMQSCGAQLEENIECVDCGKSLEPGGIKVHKGNGYCPNCLVSIDGIYYPKSETVVSKLLHRSLLKKDSVYLTDKSDYVPKDRTDLWTKTKDGKIISITQEKCRYCGKLHNPSDPNSVTTAKGNHYCSQECLDTRNKEIRAKKLNSIN